MSAYNSEKYIEAAIQSVLVQSYDNIELVVIDDGSTDSTSSILNLFENQIKVYRHGNQGQCASLNKAFELSTGSYIKFFDSDDLLNVEHIESQIQKLNGRNDVVAHAEWGRFYNDDVATYKLNFEPVCRDLAPIDWLIESLKMGHNMMQCGLWLIPRSILDKSGLWDVRLSLNNDIEFFTRVLLSSEKILFTPESILYYRSGINGSLSNKINRKSLEAALLSNRLAVQYILKAENSPRARQSCANVLQTWAYQTYPENNDLTMELEMLIAQLGDSNISPPGGPFKKLLSNIVGWKATIRVHRIWEQYRYQRKKEN